MKFAIGASMRFPSKVISASVDFPQNCGEKKEKEVRLSI